MPTRDEVLTHNALQSLPKALEQIAAQLGAIELQVATLVKQNAERRENAAAEGGDDAPQGS